MNYENQKGSKTILFPQKCFVSHKYYLNIRHQYLAVHLDRMIDNNFGHKELWRPLAVNRGSCDFKDVVAYGHNQLWRPPVAKFRLWVQEKYYIICEQPLIILPFSLKKHDSETYITIA